MEPSPTWRDVSSHCNQGSGARSGELRPACFYCIHTAGMWTLTGARLVKGRDGDKSLEHLSNKERLFSLGRRKLRGDLNKCVDA